MPEIITMKCPFCGEGDIKVLHTEASYSKSTARAAGNTKTIPVYHPPKDEVLIKKCPNCGKGGKEIQKALKEGKQPSHEEIIKRAKEAGLPLKF